MAKKSSKGTVRNTSEGWIVVHGDDIYGPYESQDEAIAAAKKKGITAEPAQVGDRSEAARRAHETRLLKGTSSEAAAKAWETRKANALAAKKPAKKGKKAAK